MKVSLGFKSSYGLSPTSPLGPKEEPKEQPTCYPSLSIRGDAARKLMSQDIDAGDTITAMVTMRVVEVRDRAASHSEYGNTDPDGSMDVEVMGLDDIKIAGEEPEEAGDGDESANDSLDSFLEEKGLKRVS